MPVLIDRQADVVVVTFPVCQGAAPFAVEAYFSAGAGVEQYFRGLPDSDEHVLVTITVDPAEFGRELVLDGPGTIEKSGRWEPTEADEWWLLVETTDDYEARVKVPSSNGRWVSGAAGVLLPEDWSDRHEVAQLWCENRKLPQ